MNRGKGPLYEYNDYLCLDFPELKISTVFHNRTDTENLSPPTILGGLVTGPTYFLWEIFYEGVWINNRRVI
jgi:hypothetical protein